MQATSRSTEWDRIMSVNVRANVLMMSDQSSCFTGATLDANGGCGFF